MSPPAKRRVFFALWPDDDCRSQLVEAQQKLTLRGDRARLVPSANLHLTLHFIGNVDEPGLAWLQRQAGDLRLPPFEITIDRIGYFKNAGVVWLGCEEPSDALIGLQRTLGLLLRGCGFQAGKRHYNPHVTMIRNQSVAVECAKFNRFQWSVTDFVLVESIFHENAVRYDVLQRYALK